MNRFNFKAGDTGWLKRTGVILLLAALLLTAYSSAIPLAHAQESDAPAATPPAGEEFCQMIHFTATPLRRLRGMAS